MGTPLPGWVKQRLLRGESRNIDLSCEKPEILYRSSCYQHVYSKNETSHTASSKRNCSIMQSSDTTNPFSKYRKSRGTGQSRVN